MLTHDVLYNIPIHWYIWLICGRNSQHSMLSLQWECWFSIKQFTRDISVIYVSTFGLFKIFCSWFIHGKYIWYFMLAFLLFWVFTSAEYYSLMKDKWTTFHVSSPLFYSISVYWYIWIRGGIQSQHYMLAVQW